MSNEIADARKNIEAIGSLLAEAGEQDALEVAYLTAQIVQAQALVAVAEQQRIANLIALATSEGSPVLDQAAIRALIDTNAEDFTTEIRPDIREGLGL